MSMGLVGVVFGAIASYGLSWGAAPKAFQTRLPLAAAVLLIGYCVFLTGTVALTAPAGLRAAQGTEWEFGGWSAIEMGVFGALLVASLPFFALAQVRASGVTGSVGLAGLVSLGAGMAFICTTSLWLMFIAFEFLLLSALYILLLTSKSERARDAALEMFV